MSYDNQVGADSFWNWGEGALIPLYHALACSIKPCPGAESLIKLHAPPGHTQIHNPNHNTQVTIVNSCYASKSTSPGDLLAHICSEWAALKAAAQLQARGSDCGAAGGKQKCA